MNLKTLLVCALLVGCLSIGFATAGVDPTPSPTQQVGATTAEHTVTLTVPASVSGWVLNWGVKNEKDVGPVYISTTHGTPYEMTLEITGNFNTWGGFTHPLFVSTKTPPVAEDTWINLLGVGTITLDKIPATSTPHPIPIRLRQEVVSGDKEGGRTLVLSYNLKVAIPPTPTTS